MAVQVELPKAFSVREENEFFPIEHLLARLNPQLMVTQLGTGVHVNGSYTVFWGIVHLEDQPPTMKEVGAALTEAGFDFSRNTLMKPTQWTG